MEIEAVGLRECLVKRNLDVRLKGREGLCEVGPKAFVSIN